MTVGWRWLRTPLHMERCRLLAALIAHIPQRDGYVVWAGYPLR